MREDSRACGLILLGIAIAACWGASRHVVGTLSSPGPGLFPLILGAVLGVLSLTIMVQDRKARMAAASSVIQEKLLTFSKEILYVLLALVAFGILFVPMGFVVTTFLVFAYLSRFVIKQKWYAAVGTAAVLAVGAYVIFDIFLGVPLPKGVFGI
jgi:putative tricarboxylic transport membrane protein